MNDRLRDLGAWGGDDDEDDDQFDNDAGGDVEMQKTAQQPSYMDHFYKEVDSIKDDIEQVKKATRKISDINEEALQATTTEKENELSNKLRPLIDATNNRAKRTKNLLGLLKEETKKLQTEGKINSSDLR
jgi:t-SNARE complex subunit (syntaxin)